MPASFVPGEGDNPVSPELEEALVAIRGARVSSHAPYDEFVAASPQGTIFCRSWWLDATAGPGGWRHADVIDADGRLVATWPAAVRSTRFGDVLTGAPLTPYLGPLLSAGDGRQRRSREVDQLESLADALKPYAHIDARCSPRLDYWAPLAWHGFSQTSHYTWRLEDVSDEEAAFAGLQNSTRRQVSKAQSSGLVVEPGSVDDLVALQRQTFERQEGGWKRSAGGVSCGGSPPQSRLTTPARSWSPAATTGGCIPPRCSCTTSAPRGTSSAPATPSCGRAAAPRCSCGRGSAEPAPAEPRSTSRARCSATSSASSATSAASPSPTRSCATPRRGSGGGGWPPAVRWAR